MIWAVERNMEQGALVAAMYQQASGVLCERKAVLAGGLPGADKAEALAQAGIDPAGYLTISIDQILTEMPRRGLIPQIARLSPLDGADLAHGEAQYLANGATPRAARAPPAGWKACYTGKPQPGRYH